MGMAQQLRVGVSIGPSWWFTLSISWPLASLEVSDEGLVLKMLWMTYRFAKEHISRLVIRRFLWVKYLTLSHTAPKCPRYVTLVNPHSQALQEALASHQYPVEGAA